MLVRNRPTPGTPIAKSASFFSANSFTCRGVITCSASAFRSSGLSGGTSRLKSSPFTRTVGGRPTLSSRSDAFRCTIWPMVFLKLKVDAAVAPETVDSAIGVNPEEDLAELHRLRVLHAHLADHTGDLGLDLVHDLHRFDDAHRLAGGHPTSDIRVGFRPRLRRSVEGSHHRGLDLLERRDRRGSNAGRFARLSLPGR